MNRRRSQRVILSVNVTVCSEGGPSDAAFEEDTRTLAVNAYGALIDLAVKVEKSQTLRLTNRGTRAEQICEVVYVGPASGGKVQIGVEFTGGAPEFWGVTFPPEDWVASGQPSAPQSPK